MIYHGVDLVETERIRSAALRWGERFLRRVYTVGELADCAAFSARPRYESLAARWAAKEAVAKAMGVGLSGLSADEEGQSRPTLRDIEVLRDADGRPSLRLHGLAATIATSLQIDEFALSMSHTKTYALASVVALQHGPEHSPE